MNDESGEQPEDIPVVWFGIMSGYSLITLLGILLIAVFGMYVLSSDTIPPVTPLAVLVVTAICAAILASVQLTDECVVSSGGEIDMRDGTEFGLLRSIHGVPTWIVIVLLAFISAAQPMIVFALTDSIRVVVLAVIEGLVAVCLGYVIGVGASLMMVDIFGGEIPNTLSGRFWQKRPDYMTPSQQNKSEIEENHE